MAERVLPPVALGPAGRSGQPVAAPWVVPDEDATHVAPALRLLPDPDEAPVTAKAARFAKPRGDAWLGTATRAGMLVGVSAAVYAVSLAAVAGMQAQTQADVAAANRPALDALGELTAANDALEAAIHDADARARAMAADYDAISGDMAAYQEKFTTLSQLVAKIEGSAAKLNANFKLPKVTMHGAIGGGGGGTTVVTTTSASGKP